MIDRANRKFRAQSQREANQPSHCWPKPRRFHHAKIGSILLRPIAASAIYSFLTAQVFVEQERRNETANPRLSDAKAILTRAKSKALAGWGFAEQSLPNF
jgi:hypothetical protein